MAITHLSSQLATNSSATNSVVATYPATPIQGDLLTALAYSSGGPNTLAISGWTSVVQMQYGSANVHCVGLLIKTAGASESTTVTATVAASTAMALYISEWQGATASPLDVTATTADTGADVTSRSSGTTGVTSQADELAIGLWGLANTNGGSISYTNSFTSLSSSYARLLTAYKILTATGTQESTATWATGRRAVGIIATFRATILGAGVINGTTAVSGTGAVGVTGSGVISGSLSMTGTGAVAKTGEGVIAGSSSVSGAGAVAVTGSGLIAGTTSVSGDGLVTINGSGIIAGTFGLTGTGALMAAGSGVIGGASSVSGSGNVIYAGSGTITGMLGMTGQGALGITGGGLIALVSSLTGSAVVETLSAIRTRVTSAEPSSNFTTSEPARTFSSRETVSAISSQEPGT